MLVEKINPISLRLNFTPNTLGCYGLSSALENSRSQSPVIVRQLFIFTKKSVFEEQLSFAASPNVNWVPQLPSVLGARPAYFGGVVNSERYPSSGTSWKQFPSHVHYYVPITFRRILVSIKRLFVVSYRFLSVNKSSLYADTGRTNFVQDHIFVSVQYMKPQCCSKRIDLVNITFQFRLNLNIE